MAAVVDGLPGPDGDMAHVAETSKGCGANRRRLRQSLTRCRLLRGRLVSEQVEDGCEHLQDSGDVMKQNCSTCRYWQPPEPDE